VVAVNDGDVAIGNDEAGFYVGDSPQADTVVRDNQAFGGSGDPGAGRVRSGRPPIGCSLLIQAGFTRDMLDVCSDAAVA
jgi:hypothetical protein